MPSGPPPLDRARCESSHPDARRRPRVDGAARSTGHGDGAMTPRREPRRRRPRRPRAAPGRRWPVRPVLGLRRNAVDYAERMWRGARRPRAHGPRPAGARPRRLVAAPPRRAARVLSGSSWRAFAKQDQVYDEIGRWLGHGLLTAEGEDWTRQKRFLQPVFTKAGGRRLRRPHGRRDRDASSASGTSPAPTSSTSASRCSGSPCASCSRRCSVTPPTTSCPTCGASFPVVSDTVIRRGLGVVRLPDGDPDPARRAAGEAAQRRPLRGVRRHRRGAPRRRRTTGGTDLLSRLLAARDGDERLDRRRGARPGARLHPRGARDDRDRPDLRAAPARPPPRRAGRGARRGPRGRRRRTPHRRGDRVAPADDGGPQGDMRLYPSAPFIGRLAVADDEVMGHPCRAGHDVVLVPWTIHRHPDFWEDPLIFDPSRFAPGARPRPRRAPLRVDAVRRRPAGLHRPALLDGRGGARPRRWSCASTGSLAVADTDQLPVGSLITLFPTEPVLARVERLP